MSTYHTPADQPSHKSLHDISQRAMTKLGRRALLLLAASVACFAAAIATEGIGQGLYGTGDWPGVTGSALGLAWMIMVAGVFGFSAVGFITAWFAILRRHERAPSVFAAALVLPMAILIGNGLLVVLAFILVAAAVLNEFIPHRLR